MTEQGDGTWTPAWTFVDDAAAIDRTLARLDGDIVGVDVERADADRYFRRAALVQVGVADACVLLDGEVFEALPQLDEFLGPDRLTILHAVENDLDPLARKGVHPERIADTAVAASMLGLPTGLGALLDEVLGVATNGDKSAFQRADWSARPLPDEMAQYAAGDVVYLPELWRTLAERLETADRMSWYEQELEATLVRASEDLRDWQRVKGAGRLSPEQRAVLKAVWEERERLARLHDVAPNRLVHDDILRSLALEPPRTEPQLVRRSRRRRSLLRCHAADLLAAIERGLDAPPQQRPSNGRRWQESDRDLYDKLRRRRAEVADRLGIEAGVLCPSRPLWNAVVSEPSDGVELCELAGLRPWQTEQLADPLWEVWTAHHTTSSPTESTQAADPS